jgi:hypothetical protein
MEERPNHGVVLTHAEARDHLRDTEWIDWEDVPNLAEQSWVLLYEAIDAATEHLTVALRSTELAYNTDSAYLLERAV